ncbi:spore protease YyaC [Limosilactobacillus fermentum]|uniref:spore protease YyaC n=1 Tax=Limosilactobacillus fermentum TaxID=1613 RepID=UPI002F26DB1D
MLTTRTKLPRYQIAKAHFKNKFQLKYLSYFIRNKLPEGRRIAVICIGSSRSTGDSLGPAVGTLLSKYGFTNVDVYGTIKDPVHALNLEQTINKMLLNEHPPFIIAVDSSLERKSSIGMIYADNQPVQPGAALHRKLRAVGDVSVTGVINIMNQRSLAMVQGTKQGKVTQMAETIAVCLERALRTERVDEIS